MFRIHVKQCQSKVGEVESEGWGGRGCGRGEGDVGEGAGSQNEYRLFKREIWATHICILYAKLR